MESNYLINEILKVITLSNVFNPENYDDEYIEFIINNVTNWVNDNNVENVEFTVSADDCEGLCGDKYIVREYTNFNVNFISCSDDNDIYDEMEKVLSENYDGPGRDINNRSDDRWNSDYFFTGSDSTFYVLIKKIN